MPEILESNLHSIEELVIISKLFLYYYYFQMISKRLLHYFQIVSKRFLRHNCSRIPTQRPSPAADKNIPPRPCKETSPINRCPLTLSVQSETRAQNHSGSRNKIPSAVRPAIREGLILAKQRVDLYLIEIDTLNTVPPGNPGGTGAPRGGRGGGRGHERVLSPEVGRPKKEHGTAEWRRPDLFFLSGRTACQDLSEAFRRSSEDYLNKNVPAIVYRSGSDASAFCPATRSHRN